MSRIALGYTNLVDSVTLSGGSWRADFPRTNLQDRALGVVARSTTAAPADSRIVLDHGAAGATPRVVAIVAHNLSSVATVTISRGTSPGASDIYAGSAQAAWVLPADVPRDGAAFAVTITLPAGVAARYTTIDISDAANAAGYVQIGRLFVGSLFAPEIGADCRQLTSDWMPSLDTVERTETGADWVWRRRQLRKAAWAWTAMSGAEADALHEITRTHGTAAEVLYVPDVSDRMRTQLYGCLGLLRELTKIEYPYSHHRAAAMAVEERGGAP
jgi:hypothetical protein